MTAPYIILDDVTLAAISAEAIAINESLGNRSMLRLTNEFQRNTLLAQSEGEISALVIQLNKHEIGPEEYQALMVRKLVRVAAMAATWLQAIDKRMFKWEEREYGG
jgi:lipase chaperone LimK